MKKIELLSPAGDFECLKAAIYAGADAVYLAGKSFSARSYASNFNNDELIEAIKFAHLYGVKIYITCNTLIFDSEIPKFLEYIDFIHRNNADAVIMQDIGMADLIHQTYPNLEIHASTQMHIHNLEGVKLAEKIGIKRVVLARETPINVIKDIIEKSNIEIEIFGHGSLCLSYSGQCLISHEIGKRSANRGLCAGTCRLKYDVISNNKIIDTNIYPLSCKDLLSIKNVGKLIESKVHSLKIEGRMKRKEYVYLTTSLYRKSIDNYYANINHNYDKDIIELKKIYNRNFTDGFLLNNDNIINNFRPNHLGIEIGRIHDVSKHFIKIKLNDYVSINDGLRILNNNEDLGLLLNNFYINDQLVKNASKNDIIKINKNLNVNIGDLVLKTSDNIQLTKINEYLDRNTFQKKIPININFCAKLNKKIKLEINDNEKIISINSDYIVTKSKTSSITTESIFKQLNKTNNTPYLFYINNIDVDDGIFIPVKILNDLKRSIIDKLNNSREYIIPYKKERYTKDVPNFTKENNTYYLLDKTQNYKSFNKVNVIRRDITNTNSSIIILPRIINKFNFFDSKILISELGSVNFYEEFDTDFSLNVTNAYSTALLHSLGANKITLSYELSYIQIKDLINNYKKIFNKNPNVEVIVFGLKELMISKYNLYNTYNNNNLFLQDKFKNKYKIINNEDYMSIYDYKISHLKNNFFEIGVNNIRFNLEYIDNFSIEKYIK